MTGNVLIKNRTPSSDVPYLFGLPMQKTTLLRHTSVLRSKTLAEGEFISPEHFNFLPESKKSAFLRRTSVLRSKTLAEGEFTSPEHLNFLPESKKRGHNIRCDLFFGAGDEAHSRHCRAATRTAGDKRPTGAFSRFARALFDPLPASFPKNKGMTYIMPLFFGAGDEARTRYLHLGKVALYQMSYARGTRCTIPDIFRFVKHRF